MSPLARSMTRRARKAAAAARRTARVGGGGATILSAARRDRLRALPRSAQVRHVLSRDHAVLPATQAFVHEWIEPYLPLPSQSWFSFTDPKGMEG